MNQDPVYQRLAEIAWRRPLTEVEQAELRAWLLAHPEAQAGVENDAALTAALTQLPDAPVPSNFTARVWQQIEAEERSEARNPKSQPNWWRRYLPRIAVAGFLVITGLGLWQAKLAKQNQLVQTAQEVASAELLSNPNLLVNFDAIASLTPDTAMPDEGLLALSEDLIALHQ